MCSGRRALPLEPTQLCCNSERIFTVATQIPLLANRKAGLIPITRLSERTGDPIGRLGKGEEMHRGNEEEKSCRPMPGCGGGGALVRLFAAPPNKKTPAATGSGNVSFVLICLLLVVLPRSPTPHCTLPMRRGLLQLTGSHHHMAALSAPLLHS